MKIITNNNHPTIINMPPRGVTGPRNRKFTPQYSENAKRYILKENRKTPVIIQIADHFSIEDVKDNVKPIISNTMAWYI